MKVEKVKINIIAIGDGGVGKTSLIHYFDKQKVSKSNIPSTGIDFVLYKTQIDGRDVQVKIWDTAGQQ